MPETQPSNEVTFTEPLPAPSGLTAELVAGEIRLSWTRTDVARSGDVRIAIDFGNGFSQLATISPSEESFTHTTPPSLGFSATYRVTRQTPDRSSAATVTLKVPTDPSSEQSHQTQLRAVSTVTTEVVD